MSIRRFATREELVAKVGQEMADFIWSAAAPSVDEFGNETPSSDPIFGGSFVPAEAGMEAELNITRLITKLDAFKSELRKVR